MYTLFGENKILSCSRKLTFAEIPQSIVEYLKCMNVCTDRNHGAYNDTCMLNA